MSDADITAVMQKHYPPQPASANPFNRQMGADVSYGAPLQAPAPAPPLDVPASSLPAAP
jgi:hypothetical protein